MTGLEYIKEHGGIIIENSPEDMSTREQVAQILSHLLDCEYMGLTPGGPWRFIAVFIEEGTLYTAAHMLDPGPVYIKVRIDFNNPRNYIIRENNRYN